MSTPTALEFSILLIINHFVFLTAVDLDFFGDLPHFVLISKCHMCLKNAYTYYTPLPLASCIKLAGCAGEGPWRISENADGCNWRCGPSAEHEDCEDC